MRELRKKSALATVTFALNSNYTYCHGDICNLDLVAHLMEFHKIDTVMHFAAQSHVDASFGNQRAMLATCNLYARSP